MINVEKAVTHQWLMSPGVKPQAEGLRVNIKSQTDDLELWMLTYTEISELYNGIKRYQPNMWCM